MMPVKQLLASALLIASGLSMANAQAPAPQIDPNAPVYVVSYVDVQQAAKAQGMTLLKQFRSACAKEDGNLRCEAAQRLEQQNEFVILEIWRNQKSFQAHTAGSGAQLRDKLKSILASPYDERVHTGLVVPPLTPAPAARVVYVVTHVDVIPPRLGDTLPLLGPMAETNRKEAGNFRSEVYQQLAPRNNHFSLVEIWGNKRQLETHQSQARTIQFRDKLQPLMGALYDERLYKVLD